MLRSPHKYLYDMIDSCEFLLEFTKGRTVDDYRADRGFRSAVERELQIVGEAVFQLRRQFPDIVEGIGEHDRIIRFRHVLVHDYGSLDAQLVWYVIVEKLAVLMAQANDILQRQCPPREEE